MAGRFKRLKIVATAIAILAVLVYLNNTSLLVDPIEDGPFLVAHRALGQDFDREGLTGKTCTASRMLPSEHRYLENTIVAMTAAFDHGADEGELLADRLAQLTAERTSEIMVVGGGRPVGVIRDRLPNVRTMTRPRLKSCLKRYLAFGWTGYVPSERSRGVLLVPANVAPWLWGWPNRLIRRMDRVGTRVVMIGDYDGGPSQGFDDPDRLTELPRGYSGGIWTNRIDLIGSAITGPSSPP